ncbi:MAG: pitrilysin family protein [Gemmatimonadaceae bacterium]
MSRSHAVCLAVAFSLAANSLVGIVVRAQGPPAPPKSQTLVIKGKAPVSNKVLDVVLPKPREGDLANGLHLIVLEDHRTPQVSFQLIIPGAGGYFDAPGATGLASVTATMMREGTPTRTTTQISEQLETIAAGFNVGAGVSSLDATASGSALTEKLDRLFELASDVLLHPTFPESELAKYKQRTAAQLAQQRSNAGFLAQELSQKVMMGDHPGARLSMTPEDVKKVTRDDMVAFYQSHYAPDHAAIAFAGDITYGQAKQLVESKLGGWKKSGAAAVSAKNPPVTGPAKVYLVDRPNSVQTSFVVGAQAIDRTSPDYDVLQMMNQVVGGGPTGRLFTHLREEKGYTYGAYSGLNAGRYTGVWSASTDVRSDVTEPALHDLLDELRQIRDVPVPAKELQDKKRSLVASFALSLESPQQVLNYYITRWTYKLPADYWDQYPKRVMAVTAPQVQAAARKYLDPKKVQIVAVGDGKKIEETLKKFGPLEVFDTEGKRRPELVP